jgi:pimeloyl-ACP methyl ester carboxylesterase
MTGLDGTVATARAGGADIRFWRTGSGDPLVLLHPLRTQLEYFLPLQAELLSEAFEVIVPDLPGHARAFRSLMLNWETWIAARSSFGEIKVPVLLAYGQHDWSRPAERDANLQAIPGVQAVSLPSCGHFSALERPRAVAGLIEPEAGQA